MMRIIVPLNILLTSIYMVHGFDNGTFYLKQPKRDFENRQARLISFKTLDDKVDVELSLSAPVFRIPIKKTMDMMTDTLVNMNLGALVVTGALFTGGTLLLPLLMFLFENLWNVFKPGWKKDKKDTDAKQNIWISFAPNSSPEKHHEIAYHDEHIHPVVEDPPFLHGFEDHPPYYIRKIIKEEDRSSSTDSPIWKYLNKVEKVLLEHDVHTVSCVQRIVCWTVQKSSENMASGKASSGDKIIDGLATNEFILQSMNRTPIYFAVQNGLNKQADCSKHYQDCNLSRKMFGMFAKNALKMLNEGW